MSKILFSLTICWKQEQDIWNVETVEVVQSIEASESHPQNSRTEASCLIFVDITETYWKYCSHLLSFLFDFWDFRSSGCSYKFHHLEIVLFSCSKACSSTVKDLMLSIRISPARLSVWCTLTTGQVPFIVHQTSASAQSSNFKHPYSVVQKFTTCPQTVRVF